MTNFFYKARTKRDDPLPPFLYLTILGFAIVQTGIYIYWAYLLVARVETWYHLFAMPQFYGGASVILLWALAMLAYGYLVIANEERQ